MDEETFKYAGIAHSASGADLVGFHLQRDNGTMFLVLLDTKNATALIDDLAVQVRIASGGRTDD